MIDCGLFFWDISKFHFLHNYINIKYHSCKTCWVGELSMSVLLPAWTCLFAIISFWQVQESKTTFKPRSKVPHLQYPYEVKPCPVLSCCNRLKKRACLPGLKCLAECSSTSLCSLYAMLYHVYTKDSLLTSWLPPLAHMENAQYCKDIAQPHFQCGSGSHKAVGRAPSTAPSRLVRRGLIVSGM